MNTKRGLMLSSLVTLSMAAAAKERPNIVVLFADDISAREFPVYGSSVWTSPLSKNTSDINLRAKTPVMEQLVEKGVMINNAWACSISSPSRAQMMTGRYAATQKWWHNGDCGAYLNAQGKQETWPLYESSPLMMGKIAQKAGYATVWVGKTQMAHTDTNIDDYGFDEGCYTPGNLSNPSPYTDFVMDRVKGEKRLYKVRDTGKDTTAYMQTSYYWYPSVQRVNAPNAKKKNQMEPWGDNTEKDQKFGLTTYGPDVEQDYIFDFMERKQSEKKPFLVYHTAHVGHDAFNFLDITQVSKWPSTPIVKWDGKKYTRVEPKITGDNGVYDTHNTLSPMGMHSHVTYLDYMIWRYTEQFKKMGIADNTVLIIAADNGTSGYGKASPDRQKGVHIPLIIYAPCLDMTKSGAQDVLANIGDIVPTVADLVGFKIPKNYHIDGESMVPFLTTSKPKHREWIYSYRSQMQLIRGQKVLRDGFGKWWDVEKIPADLISFPQITDWSKVSAAHRAERDKLEQTMKQFDVYTTEYNGPDGNAQPKFGKKR